LERVEVEMTLIPAHVSFTPEQIDKLNKEARVKQGLANSNRGMLAQVVRDAVDLYFRMKPQQEKENK
jgi:hypothetical protein